MDSLMQKSTKLLKMLDRKKAKLDIKSTEKLLITQIFETLFLYLYFLLCLNCLRELEINKTLNIQIVSPFLLLTKIWRKQCSKYTKINIAWCRCADIDENKGIQYVFDRDKNLASFILRFKGV